MNKYFVLLIGILLAVNLVAAEYKITNSSIGTNYPQDTYLSGWIDVSFKNQSLNSLFSDSLDNEFSLKEVLNHSSNYIYSCQDNDCDMSYSSKNPSTIKNFNFATGNKEKFIGMVFTGKIEEITSVKFNLSSNALESEENQIRIDILDDDKIDAGNTKIGTKISNKENYGCFDGEESLEEVNMGANIFCQKVELDEAPAFFIGAWIKEITPGEINVTMELYYEAISLGSCLIDRDEITTSGVEVFCKVNVPVAEKDDYYICMSAKGSGEYRTIGYSSINQDKNCGFIGVPVKNEISSYGVGAKGVNYGPVGNIEISNTLSNGEKISDLIEEYIKDTYGSLDCTGISCQVPIRLISSTNQSININAIEIKYEKNLGPITEEKFYDFEMEPGIINSNSQKLYLNNLFKLPSKIGEFDYILEFEDDKIFDKELNIEEISIVLSPLISASNFPITFQVNIYPDFKFSNYKWDFGDGGIETSIGNQKSHTYKSIGNYTLNVVAITKDGSEFSKSFKIIVELPEKMINGLIKDLETKLTTLKQQILLLGTFEKEEIYKRINLDEIEINLSYIKEDMKIANEDSEYKQIIDQLLLIKIPQSIIQTSTNQIFFYSQKDNVNLNILEEITQESSGVSEDTINSILIWNQNNLNSKISMKDILIKWDKVVEPYFKTFELSINPIYTQEDPFYFIIEDIEDLDFKGNISMQEVAGYLYFPIAGPTTLKFSTTENFDFLTLPMFISPRLEKVRVEEISLEQDANKTVILFVILIALFFIGLLTYIILQKWYKTRYEKYLFKERNQLYNVATYIHNAKENNVSEDEIRKTLKNAGWNGEQITYALRKYSGKRTGMYEIPVRKLLEKKEEQIKQQQKDTKFNKGYSPN